MDEGNQVFPQGGSTALLVIEFPSFRDFIDAYSPIISEEGIFVRNADVSESNAFSVGDRVDFEVRLKDDFRLIQGAGEVIWLGSSDAADGAQGTAIRFHDVDEPSQRLIARLVGNYVGGGGKLFDVGGSTAEAAPALEIELASEPDSEPRTPFEPPFEEMPGEPRLTAERLEASEADALFASDNEAEPSAPLELESVSLEDVESTDLDTEDSKLASAEVLDPVGVSLDDPVGLDTIAIPSGLIDTLVSDVARDADSSDAGSEPEGLGGVHHSEPGDGAVSAGELPAPPVELPPVELPAVDEGVPGAEAALAAAADPDLPRQAEVLLEDRFDEASLEAAADSMEAGSGGRGRISDDIAQVAEELSGVHRIELPEPNEGSGSTYTGYASAQPARKTGSRIAALSVAFVLLGAGAFYFGDTMLGFLGLGYDQDGATATEIVRSGEIMPPPGAPATQDAVGVPPLSAPEMPESGDQAESSSVSADSSAGAATGAPTSAPSDPPGELTPTSRTTAAKPMTHSGTAAPSTPVATASARAASPASAVPPVSDLPRRVESITWREEGGSTIVTIRLSTELSNAYFEVVRVRAGAPREVIKIQGIEVPYTPSEIAVGSRHVLRLRTGLHRADGGTVLHVVADLTGAGVAIRSVEPDGRDLRITFS